MQNTEAINIPHTIISNVGAIKYATHDNVKVAANKYTSHNNVQYRIYYIHFTQQRPK
jgi:hypothetical protein